MLELSSSDLNFHRRDHIEGGLDGIDKSMRLWRMIHILQKPYNLAMLDTLIRYNAYFIRLLNETRLPVKLFIILLK